MDVVACRLTVVSCAFCKVCSLKWCCSKGSLSKFVYSLQNILKNVLNKEKVSKYERFKWDAPSGKFQWRNSVIAMFDSIVNERSKLVRFHEQNHSGCLGIMEAVT
jgi:hypothetical protein